MLKYETLEMKYLLIAKLEMQYEEMHTQFYSNCGGCQTGNDTDLTEKGE